MPSIRDIIEDDSQSAEDVIEQLEEQGEEQGQSQQNQQGGGQTPQGELRSQVITALKQADMHDLPSDLMGTIGRATSYAKGSEPLNQEDWQELYELLQTVAGQLGQLSQGEMPGVQQSAQAVQSARDQVEQFLQGS